MLISGSILLNWFQSLSKVLQFVLYLVYCHIHIMTQTIPVHNLLSHSAASCNARAFHPFSGASDNEEAHRHNYYELLFFDQGNGSHMIDFETHRLQSTSLHFVSPGQVHTLNREKGVKGYVVNFTKEFFLLHGGHISVLNDFPAFNKIVFPILKTKQSDFNELISLVKQMNQVLQKDSVIRESVLVAYINLILIKCKALLVETADYKKNNEPTQQLMQRFNALLEENYTEWRKITDYAERLNLSPNHLSAAIKKITGKTAGELIHQRLILEAKRLLLHSDSSAKEISYLLNFSDPPYFTRFFKTNTGYSPENFRNEIRKKYR